MCKKRKRIFKKNWAIEELLNKIKKDDFDFYSLEEAPDYFYETLENILPNIEDYKENMILFMTYNFLSKQ